MHASRVVKLFWNKMSSLRPAGAAAVPSGVWEHQLAISQSNKGLGLVDVWRDNMWASWIYIKRCHKYNCCISCCNWKRTLGTLENILNAVFGILFIFVTPKQASRPSPLPDSEKADYELVWLNVDEFAQFLNLFTNHDKKIDYHDIIPQAVYWEW